MKRISSLTAILFFYNISFAQLTAEQRIQDSVIGWWDNKKFDNQLKPTTDPIQKRRIQIDDSLVSWMKKSYTPVGGLGTYTRQNNQGWFGVQFAVWNVSHKKIWTDAQGHFRPIDEENTPFALQANTLPAIQVFDFLNGNNDYYFTWQPDGYMVADEEKRRKNFDFKNHQNVSRFITRITNRQNCVILSPGNKSPFVAVTIGEFIEKAEACVEKEKQKEKERINAQWPGSDAGAAKARNEAYAYKEQLFQACLKRIQKLKQVYQNKLNEPATFNASHQTLLSAFNDDNFDPFAVTDIEKGRKQYYLVYKVPSDIVEKCKSDKPQWITAWWPFQTKQDGNQLYEMSTAMTENVNYEYIYNYFYDPEKIKGKSYTPANAEQLKSRLDNYRKKNVSAINPATNNNSWAANVHFKDDFSTSSEGSDPANWYFNKNGKHSIISTIKNDDGKWLALGFNNEVFPSLLKKPLPENFTLEFDVATDEFNGRYGGSIFLMLSTWPADPSGRVVRNGDGAVLNIQINSGSENDFSNNNYSGLTKLELRKSPEVNTENNSGGASGQYELREFTNKKNKVHVALKINNGEITLLINNKIVITAKDMKLVYGGNCLDCSVPVKLRFNYLAWKCTTDKPDETNVYIGNIKITKD